MNFKLLKFIKRIAFFIILFVLIFSFALRLISFVINYKLDSQTIYIWGDSQIYQGINLKQVSQNGTINVLSAAKHGAGVYDFSVFCSAVPPKSTALVGFSPLVFIRKKENDRNKSGFSFQSIAFLLQNGYSFSEIYSIYNQNLFPKNIFHTRFGVFNNADTIIYKQSIALFEELIKASDSYLLNKAAIYSSNLDILIQKNCKIVIIETPLAIQLDTLLKSTHAYENLEMLKRQVIIKHNLIDTTIYLQTHQNIMYDLTHLNELGNKEITEKLKQLSQKNYFIHFKQKKRTKL